MGWGNTAGHRGCSWQPGLPSLVPHGALQARPPTLSTQCSEARIPCWGKRREDCLLLAGFTSLPSLFGFLPSASHAPGPGDEWVPWGSLGEGNCRPSITTLDLEASEEVDLRDMRAAAEEGCQFFKVLRVASASLLMHEQVQRPPCRVFLF